MPPRHSRIHPDNKGRLKIWEDTIAHIHKHCNPEDYPDTVPYGFVKPHTPNPDMASRPTARIEFANEHSFAAAHRLVLAGHKPMVVNMASVTHPGGGVTLGCPAQEEDLYRLSDYVVSLNQVHRDKYYPITKTVLYSPQVTVLRRPGTYTWISDREQITVACLAAAALPKPQVRVDCDGVEQYVHPEDYEHTRALAQTIMSVAADTGHDAVVLGAIGCGAYKGPRHDIARAFKEALDCSGHQHSVQRVVFAILARDDTEAETIEIFRSTIGAGCIGGPKPIVRE